MSFVCAQLMFVLHQPGPVFGLGRAIYLDVCSASSWRAFLGWAGLFGLPASGEAPGNSASHTMSPF